MWCKVLHEKYGYFDDSFESAGDWEFWLRVSQVEKYLHIREYLGLYLKSPFSIEHRNPELSAREIQRVKNKYVRNR